MPSPQANPAAAERNSGQWRLALEEQVRAIFKEQAMKPMRILAGMFVMVVSLAATMRGQEKARTVEEPGPITQLKLQIVLTEMDGTKKISSLPYVLHVLASEGDFVSRQMSTQLRTGFRVPMATGSSKDNTSTYQLIDVGTNIDSSARSLGDGRYKLHLTVDRSTVVPIGGEDTTAQGIANQEVRNAVPLIRQFRNSFELLVRDGQTVQATVASDPASGHVLMMDVTINVEK